MAGEPNLQWGTVPFAGFTFPVSLSGTQPNGPLDLYIRRTGGLRPNLTPVYFGPDGLPEEPLIYFSEGAYGLHLGKLCLPYVNTTQTALVSLDHSGFRAADRRVHSINSELNAGGLRWYAGIGTKIVRDTSTSNPALVVADTFTNNVTAVSHICLDETRYLAFATDGTTDDVKGTTDPTASPPSWTTLFPLTSGDYVSGMAFLPTLAGGINVYYGTINGVTAVSFNRCSDPLLTLPAPIELATGATDPVVDTNATYANCGTAASDNDIGTVAWTNPGNATALDGVFATAALNANTSEYLKCTNYGFAVPTTATIVGVEVMVSYQVNDVSPDILWTNVRLVDNNDAFFGINQAAAEPAIEGPGGANPASNFVKFFGGSGDSWGTALTPAIVNDADFGVGIAFREPSAAAETISVDLVTMTVFYKEGTDYVSVTKSPTKAFQQLGGETSSAAPSSAWNTPSNAFASDNTDARATWSVTVDQNTNKLFVHKFDMGIPENATIRGIVVQVERSESNAAANAVDETIRLVKDLAAVGDNKARTSQELETTDTTFAYGGPDDLWGTIWTPEQVNAPGFGVVVEYEFDANDIDVDHIQVTVYYQVPTTIVTLEPGGTMIADPFDDARLWVLAPETAQTGAITAPRSLYVIDLSWNDTDDVPVGTVSKPYTGLPYVSHLVPYQGGGAIAGGSNSSLFNQVRYVSSGFETRDLDFPPVHGTNAVTITAMFAQGEFLIVDTAYTDGSEAQRWLYYDGEWYPEWVQQDKASAISTEPLLWAESELGLQQNYAYRFYPVSTTALAAAREFVPPNLYADPLLANTSVVKQDGPLYTQLVEVFPASPEFDYAIVAVQSQSRFVDDKTPWGTVRVRVDTGGDRTVASAEVDKTFPTTTATFADSNIVSSGDPGAAYRSLIVRLDVDHTAGSAKTPDGLPVALFSAAQGRFMETFAVALSFQQTAYQSPVHLFDALKTLKATKAVQRFQGGGYDCPAIVKDVNFEYRPTLGSTPPSWSDVKQAVIVFERQVGSTS